MVTIQEQVTNIANKIHLIWVLSVFTFTVLALIFFPVWCFLFIIPFGLITYFGAQVITATKITNFILTALPENSEVKEIITKLQDGELSPGPKLMKLLSKVKLNILQEVHETSEQIGTFSGNPIFKWVTLKDDETGEIINFEYSGIAADELPIEIGKQYIAVLGLLYVRSFL